MKGLMEVAAVSGMTLGIANSLIQLRGYLRDRPLLRVLIESYGAVEPRNILRVLNRGRRLIEIRRVGVVLKRSERTSFMPLHLKPIQKRLLQGESLDYPFLIADYCAAPDWHRLRGFVEDYSGKLHYSSYFGHRYETRTKTDEFKEPHSCSTPS